LTSVEGYLSILFNTGLNMCCALCPLLQEDDIDDTVIGDFIEIEGNAVGCEESDVRACSPCMREDTTIDSPEVPTVSEWGLIILCLAMLITAVVGIRERVVSKNAI